MTAYVGRRAVLPTWVTDRDGVVVLVLVSFGLVLVATVLLVVGLLLGEGLTLIYLSIAISVLAAIVLLVAVRVGRPKVEAKAAPAEKVAAAKKTTARQAAPRATKKSG